MRGPKGNLCWSLSSQRTDGYGVNCKRCKALMCHCLRLDGWGVDGDGNCWTCGKAVPL
jgi:hypothetical protein